MYDRSHYYDRYTFCVLPDAPITYLPLPKLPTLQYLVGSDRAYQLWRQARQRRFKVALKCKSVKRPLARWQAERFTYRAVQRALLALERIR